MVVATSCSYKLVNLAMVGRQLQYRYEINECNIIKLLTHNIYMENTKIVRLVIFWEHLWVATYALWSTNLKNTLAYPENRAS